MTFHLFEVSVLYETLGYPGSAGVKVSSHAGVYVCIHKSENTHTHFLFYSPPPVKQMDPSGSGTQRCMTAVCVCVFLFVLCCVCCISVCGSVTESSLGCFFVFVLQNQVNTHLKKNNSLPEFSMTLLFCCFCSMCDRVCVCSLHE